MKDAASYGGHIQIKGLKDQFQEESDKQQSILSQMKLTQIASDIDST